MIVAARSPGLVNVTACCELVVFSRAAAKVSEAGDGVARMPCAVPLRLTAGATGIELLANDKAALRAPRAEGAKITLIVQLAPAAREGPQLLVWVKSEAPILLIVRLLIESVVVPVLVKVRVCGELVLPTSCGGKLKEVDE